MLLKVNNIVIVFCLIIFLSEIGKAQNNYPAEIGKPLINYFSPKVYKSGPRNWSIAQDNRGAMYFGNESGVLEYDGNNWRKIEVPGNQSVRSIAADKNGRIYVCASTDFGFLAPDSIGQLKFNSLLPFLDKKYKSFGEVWDVATSTDGVFFKTKSEIFKWNGSKITVWDSVFAFRLYNINDTIYSRNSGVGLMQIDGDDLKLMPNGDFFASIGVYDMLPFKKNNKGKTVSILVTTNTDGLFTQKDNRFVPFKTEADEYLKTNQIYNTTITSDSNYAFATQRGGLVLINQKGELLKIVNENSGLHSNVCFDIYSDTDNGLWIASDFGINYLKEPSSISIFKNSGALKNLAYSVHRYKNRIYVTNELGVLIWEGAQKGFQLLNGSNDPAFVFGEFKDDLLVGTNSGTYYVEGRSINKMIFDGSTKYICPSKLFHNRIYIASYYGFSVLEKINNSFVETYSKELPDETIKLLEDDEGSLWINGFFPGLVHVSGNLKEFSKGLDDNVKFETFDKSNGLYGNILFINKIKSGILITTNEGVFFFDKDLNSFKPFKSFGKVLSDSANQISLIEKGQNNDLWILADMNNKTSLGKAVYQNNGNYIWKPIPELWRTDLESVSSIYSDIDPKTGKEKLWISTQEGLILYDGISEKNNLNDYKTLIRKVNVNGDSLIYGGTSLNPHFKKVELEFADNDISFEYSAIQFDKSSSTYFQTFLEGDENKWSDWSLETKKNFTNLSQGDYKFHVKARNIYGVISFAEPFSFTILAPWYFTWWAYLLYTILIGGTLFSIRKLELNRKEKNNRLRMSELKAEAAEFQAKAAETQARLMQADIDRKTKELEEARSLQLSMLPKKLPELSNLDISVYMKTATEVGGDYYDFSFKNDGSLNVALGDATGHGMKAGTLVTMMKSLFTANSIDKSIELFFLSSNNALKESKLDRMMMTFGMINISVNKIKICNAGIPPIFIYRNVNKSVEEIEVNGLPLGAMKNTKYTIYKNEISTGDTIIMLSDGFPELLNDQNEMYGYERLKDLISKIGFKQPDEILEILKKEKQMWSGSKDPDDDVTFVVIKVK